MSNNPNRRNRRRRSRSGSNCDVGDCCDIADIFDGPCLISLFTIPLALFSLARPVPTQSAAPRGVAGFLWRRVRAYQLFISAKRPACCPMTPTCSKYAQDSLARHGALRGTILTLARLRRCGPGGTTGLDPVPS